MSDSIRIGNASGFYGDRFSGMREMLEGGDLDYLTGDYLAELTMLILGRDRLTDPSTGYAKTFVRQLGGCLELIAERKVRVVTNAGGLNPAGCAEQIRTIIAESGLNLSVAHVEGDDLIGRVDELGLAEAGAGVVTANAYLGAFGIAEALRSGADIVVTGRVTDASVVVGPAIFEFGWGREDFDQLAGAVVVGHILECGAQATGGNFSGWRDFVGQTNAAGMPGALDPAPLPLGFPLAELHADGTSVITKHPGTGGAVTVDTVTAQLVYEVQAEPYLGPDVTTQLGSISLASAGDNRVRITGVVGTAPPETVKVGLNRLAGHRNSVEFLLTGLDIEGKAQWVRSQLDAALAASGQAPEVIEWQLVNTTVEDPQTQEAATSILRCHVKSTDPQRVDRAFSGAAVELALASYPGFALTRPPGPGTPYGVFGAAYVPQTDVPHVVVLGDGTRLDIPAPTPDSLRNPSGGAQRGTADCAISRESVASVSRVPLGRLVHARSGDKGGNANVGLWIPAGHPRRDEAFAWLSDLLTVDEVRRLLPEAAELGIDIHALPNLAAVNIVIHGLLGEGVAASTRIDPQAKALGEWIRARHVDIPQELLP
ncbi:MAG: acyclic terpene utilization AtuA family protein [Knoellia sp.]